MQIYFQSSLPRAGSTLFQNVIAQNPEFYATPTSGLLELLYAARANYSVSPEFKAQDARLMEDAFRGFCSSAMEGYFKALTDKPYVLDKSRGWTIHYDFLNFVYPNPKIVCFVRDLRDVFCSMEKNFRKNQHKDIGIVSHAQMKGTTTEKRIDIWAASQPIGLAIERLQEVIKQKISDKILFIKYEDFCVNPSAEMKRVYDFFELDFFQHDFNNVEQVTKEDDEVYGIFGDHNIKTKIEPIRSNAKEVLGINACNWIRNNYSWFYDYFKYK
jgi:sulfotransferase